MLVAEAVPTGLCGGVAARAAQIAEVRGMTGHTLRSAPTMNQRPAWSPPLAAALAVALVVTLVAGRAPGQRAAPNILFVMIDDLGWMDIAPQGNDRFVTPALDRFAAQGTRFTDFYAAAPVCSPTRAACITGLAPARVKVTNHIPDRWSFYDARGGGPREWGPARSRHVLDKKHRTIAQRLKAAGYRTGFVGKWHLAGPDWKTTDTSLFPESYGFDVNVAGNAMGGPGTFFAPIRMPNYEAGEPGDYLPDLLAREAVDFIAAAEADDRPFFLCLWTYTVHYPIQATPELYARYTDDPEPDMPTRYRAMVEGMDRAVGRVLRALDDMGLASDTLVVFTSDNGQMPGASVADPLRAAKGYLYEGGIRVPMMIRWPGRVRAGAVESTPAISMDFAPTFLDAAGIDCEPDEFDGESLLPVAAGTGELERDAIYVHYPHYSYHGRNDMGSVVRAGSYKYIHHYDNDDHELFDLSSDIGEKVNLRDDMPDKVAELRGKLEAWLAATGAELPRPYADIPAAELPGRKRPAPRPRRAPNVVIVLADDMGYGDPRCFNRDSRIPTPHIDGLARDGMRFVDAHAPGSWCVPSRYGLLTGRYPCRVGRFPVGQKAVIEPGRVTLASFLRDQGYVTAMVGKWHLGFDGGAAEPGAELSGGPLDRGFDRFFGIHSSLDIPPYYYIRGRAPVTPPTGHVAASGSPGWSKIQGAFWREGGIAPGFVHADVLPRFGREAVAFLDEHGDDDRPFLLYVALAAPHTPWLPDEDARGSSGADMYGDFVTQVDDEVGRILAALDRNGQRDETLVVFTSDNGPVWYPKDVERFGHSAVGPLRGMKSDSWEGGHRMPFVARWPGTVPAGTTARATICFTDLLATVADVVGVPLPEGAGEDGHSLLPVLRDPEAGMPNRRHLVLGANASVVREGRWKLITHLGSGGFSQPRRVQPEPGGPRGQLYDLEADPGETDNLWSDRPEIVARLERALASITK